MKKILEMLNTGALNEAQQTLVEQKLADIIDVRVKEQVNEALEAEKKSLTESYEEKFEDYKKDITSKFSNFVDSILEEELVIPDNVVEYARKGELYSDLIEQFKVRLGIDEGVLDKEARELLKEARDEILSLQDEVNSLTENTLVFEHDAQTFAAELYKVSKCDGLPTVKRQRVLALLEDVTSPQDIDRKFKLIVEGKLHEDEDADEKEFECTCPKCGKNSTEKTACNLNTCPDCDEKLEDVDKPKEEKKDEVNESPFSQYADQYIKVLKENKI